MYGANFNSNLTFPVIVEIRLLSDIIVLSDRTIVLDHFD